MPCYTISSPLSLKAQVSLKTNDFPVMIISECLQHRYTCSPGGEQSEFSYCESCSYLWHSNFTFCFVKKIPGKKSNSVWTDSTPRSDINLLVVFGSFCLAEI